jgi:FSR family fosmidomycin resistance protein-like MFS transporter
MRPAPVSGLTTSDRPDRLSIAWISFGHLSSDLSQGAVPALLPYLIAHRGLSYAQATALLLALTVASSIIQPLFGMRSDRAGDVWLMPVGAAVAGIGVGLAGVVSSYPAMVAVVAVGGVGVAAFHPEAARHVALASGRSPGTGMGVFSVGGNAGFLFGPLTVVLGVALFGLTGTMLVAVPGLVAAAGLAAVRPRMTARLAVDERPRPDDHGFAHRRAARTAFAIVSALIVARSAVAYGLMALIPIWFVAHLDRSAAAGNLAITVLAAAGTVGTLVGGRIADRVGMRPVIVIPMVAMVPLLAVLPLAEAIGAIVVLAVVGLLLDANFGITILVAQRALPDRQATASGVAIGLAVGLGGAFAAGLGVLADSAGLTVAMEAIAVLGAVTAVLAVVCPVPRGA